MRKILFTLFLAVAAATAQTQTVPLQSPPPPPPFNVGAVYSGPTGNTTVSYWVVARYAAGRSSPSVSPATVRVQNLASITMSTPVTVTFATVAGATGYDVIRNTSTAYPAGGGCASCAIALNITGSPASDTGSTNAYPPAGVPAASQASAVIDLNNRDASTPYLEVGINGGAPVQIPTVNTPPIIPPSNLVRTCIIVTGDPGAASPVLADDNDSPNVCKNKSGAPMTITSVSCSYLPSGGANPIVNPILSGGSATSILTAVLTCDSTAAGAPGTVNGAPILPANGTIDANIFTAGGTAKYTVVTIALTL